MLCAYTHDCLCIRHAPWWNVQCVSIFDSILSDMIWGNTRVVRVRLRGVGGILLHIHKKRAAAAAVN